MRCFPARGRRSIGRAIGVLATAALVAPGPAAADSESFAEYVPPSIEVRLPADRSLILRNMQVSLDFGCTGTGIVSCTARAFRDDVALLGTVQNCYFLPSRLPGRYRIDFEALNNQGARATRSVTYDVPAVLIPTRLLPQPIRCWDTVPPKIAIGAPRSGGYERGELVRASFNCAELPAASGVASCTAVLRPPTVRGRPRPVVPVKQDQLLNTAAAGTYFFEVTALDKAGNEAMRRVTYRVASPRAVPGGDPAFDTGRSRY